ncbi:MAG: 3'-5' exonuclease domain-containing protein 2 [Candidatus Cloacimonetes bacterium]|nr:3'-5' exonuclease domain-containing protein 2 [Candidatus Cloacimonadota bacterium]
MIDVKSITNVKRLKLMHQVCSEQSMQSFEESLSKTLSKVDKELFEILRFFSLIDNCKNIDMDSLDPYLANNRKVIVIKSDSDLKNHIKAIKESRIIGFDTEKKPTFIKNQKENKIAIVQIATKQKSYVIQVKALSNLKPIFQILESPKIIKVGIGLKNDKSDLRKHYKVNMSRVIDLNEVFKDVLGYFQEIGTKKLTAVVLNQKIQKSKKTGKSNWEIATLTPSQIQYASDDACVVYDILIKLFQDHKFILQLMPDWVQAIWKSYLEDSK